MSESPILQRLFPSLPPGKWMQLNLDCASKEHFPRNQQMPPAENCNPLLKAEDCSRLVLRMHELAGVNYSYGGYLEDRAHFLRGSYLEEHQSFLHLGVDFSVPSGTEVAATVHGRVIDIFDDHDHAHGWGPRVVLQVASFGQVAALVFGHLDDIQVIRGQVVEPRTILAVVGSPPVNGNWWPHLHLQALSPQALRLHSENDFSALDGYGQPALRDSLSEMYPNPLEIP